MIVLTGSIERFIPCIVQHLVREVGALQRQFPKLDWSRKQDLAHEPVQRAIAAAVESAVGREERSSSRLAHSFTAMQIDPISLQDHGNSISAGPRLANGKAQFMSRGVYKAVDGYSPAVRGTLSLYQTIPKARGPQGRGCGEAGSGNDEAGKGGAAAGAKACAPVAGRKLADGQFEEWSGRSVGRLPARRQGAREGVRDRPATSMSLRDRLYAKMRPAPAPSEAAAPRSARRGLASSGGPRQSRSASAPVPDSSDANGADHARAANRAAVGAGLVDSAPAKQARPHTAASSVLSAASTAALVRDDVNGGAWSREGESEEMVMEGLKSKYKVRAWGGSGSRQVRKSARRCVDVRLLRCSR